MVYKFLPYSIFRRLFGDRKKFGLSIDENDSDWVSWQNNYYKFYKDNQKGTIGHRINHYGFKIMSKIKIEGLKILEIGPGYIEHLDYNSQQPLEYHIADIDSNFLQVSEGILTGNYKIKNVSSHKTSRTSLPFEDNSIDVIVTFHQLEHVYNLNDYMYELHRIIKKGGHLVGAVPTEGSIAWGLGRFLTSRRYVKKNMDFNYDKIICWEHPNFVNKIQKIIKAHFKVEKEIKKPFNFLPFDFNFSYSFIAIKE